MKRTAVALVLLALLAGAAAASLVPPGGSAKRGSALPPSPKLPAALAGGAKRSTPERFAARVVVSPAPARVGQRLRYRGSIQVPGGYQVRFDRPVSGGEFTWGDSRTGRTSLGSSPRAPYGTVDSVWLEVPLQVFATGPVSIPGLALEITPPAAEGGSARRMVRRLPTAHLVVLPTITAADTNAQWRALHGPVRAPWWERVPWRWVIGGALLLAALVTAIVLLRRRKPAPAPAPAAPRPVVVRDPAAEALAALAELRRQQLPEAGRFGDHALALTRILRRYLEAVVGTPRPGDTSGELVARLRQSRLEPAEVERLEGLLGLWDRVKFARAPLGLEEALRCEAAVETLVRRGGAREVA